jgi:LCP family protein required for cell wall assembly
MTAPMRSVGNSAGRQRVPNRRNKWIWIGAILGILGLALASGLYYYFSVAGNLKPPAADAKEIEQALDAPPKTGVESNFTYVLILGNDRKPGESRARSDTIIVARLDKRDNSVLMLSIPRDTRVEVPGHGTTKINHASSYGGIPLSIETVKNFTGLPINHYVEIDFEGFAAVVDALGGVTMNVERTSVYTGGVVNKGTQVLNGKEALAVVRNRKGYADGDFARMRNQQAFLLALAKKMSEPANIAKIPNVMNKVSDDATTDLSVPEVVSLVRQYGSGLTASRMNAYSMPGTTGTIGGVSYVLATQPAAGELFAAIGRGETPVKPGTK